MERTGKRIKNKAVRKYLSCILASAMVAGMMQPAAAQEPEAVVIVEAEDTDNGNDDSDTEEGEAMGPAVELEAAEILELPEEWQDTEPETAEQSEPDMQEENTADTEVSEDTALDTDETEGENPQETESELLVDEAGIQTFAIDEITVLDESETALDEMMPLFATEEESGTCGENASWTRKGSVLTISGSGAVRWSWDSLCDTAQKVTGITEIVIEKGITELAVSGSNNGVFKNFINLQKITLPDTITKIGNYTFANCSSLTSVDIPSGVTSISEGTFDSCTSLTTVHLPNNLKSIGKLAFADCHSLTSIDLPKGLIKIEGQVFGNCSSLTSIEIPNGVTSIGEETFYNCSSLVSIDLPGGIVSIGNSAFYNCRSLPSIDLPDSVTSIGARAFANCTSLRLVKLPNQLTSISNWTFYMCSSLLSIDLPDTVTAIGEMAFCLCTALKTVEFPKNLISIGDSAFCGCSALTSIDLPDSVQSIEEQAFLSCDALRSVDLPKSLKILNRETFYNCRALTSVEIPAGMEQIGKSAFYDCKALEKVVIPKSVTSIGEKAFYRYSGPSITIYGCSDSAAAEYTDMSTNPPIFVPLEQTYVEGEITALPDSITIADKFAVQSARAAYDELIEKEKDKISSENLKKLTDAEEKISELEINAVKAAIAALPELSALTYSSKAEVRAARKAYAALKAEQQEQITSELLKLTDAEAKIAELESAVNTVKQLLAALPAEAQVTYADKAEIETVRETYAALAEDQQTAISVGLMGRLLRAENRIAKLKAELEAAEKAIMDLPDCSVMTLSDKTAVTAARKGYEGLTKEQQAVIADAILERLTAAENRIMELEKSLAEVEAAKTAIEELPDLSQISLNDKAAIEAARAAYEGLTEEQKQTVPAELLTELTAAENQIAELEKPLAEVEAAKTVIEKLPELSKISLNDKTAIEAARKAYEGLNDAQKAQITNEILTQLTAAENKIAELEKAEQEKAEQDKETEHVHAYSAWKTTSKATVFSAEIQTRTCSCGAAETRTVGKKLIKVLELPGKLTAISIKKGNTKSFAVTMANGDSVSSVKSSAAKTVRATLDKKTGEITLKALKTGTVKLTIKLASGESKKYSVNVVSGTVKTKALSVTSVKNKKLTLAKGKTHTLKAERKPFTSTQKLTYTSSDKKVATVSSAGKIKAVAPGKATITVKSGSKSVKITVTVPGIANVKTSVSVKKNKTLTLNPKIYGIAEKVTYTSSNKKVATVTAKGKIKGIKKGTAKITIQAGSYKTTVKVKVQ